MATFRKASLCLALIMVAGCQVRALSAPPQQVGPQATQAAMNSVTIIDRTLAENRSYRGQEYSYGKIRIESSGGARTATGTLEAWATVQNLTDHPQQLQARTRFFDENKRPLENYSAWQRFSLAPKSLATYKESSLSPAAAFYYVEVSEAP